MKILIVHNRYRIRAGEDNVFDQEAALLKEHGNEVKTWTVDNQNIPEKKSSWQQIKLAFNTIWSISAYRSISKIIKEFKPDIVHVHNILPLLSPSIFYACKKQKVPVIQTIHNYRLGCPAATYFRDEKICELCVDKSLLNSIRYRCYRNSYAQTTIVAAMLQIHRWLGTWENIVSGYIALTPFMKDKLIQLGIPEEKIFVKPNFINNSITKTKPISFGKYYLFVGRLSPEKGIHVLLEAYKQCNTSYPLVIIGKGELQNIVEDAAKNDSRIQYLGQQPREKVLQYMQEAIALIFPSVWQEPFGLSIIEAYSQSLPVIGADVGSVNQLIQPHLTGLLYSLKDALQLGNIFEKIEGNCKEWLGLKNKLKDHLNDKYFSQTNVEIMLSIYQQIIQKFIK
ncbi:MAG: glycosyltransferase [Limnothrix sp.]